ncbi:MAG: cation-translocating P-type ATPase, partial [Candidatus Kerfeldbacteria bacterium]|nr:cation-translocating P-type ATPase [Candidatus Kerfeldbacteria bacterium]
MHCASCAVNIQRRLRKTPGVHDAHVNYGSEEATVSYDPKAANPDAFAKAVGSLGYKAHVHVDHDHAAELSDEERNTTLADLKRKVSVSAVFTFLLLIGAMAPFAPDVLKDPWLMWALATPVQFWA